MREGRKRTVVLAELATGDGMLGMDEALLTGESDSISKQAWAPLAAAALGKLRSGDSLADAIRRARRGSQLVHIEAFAMKMHTHTQDYS